MKLNPSTLTGISLIAASVLSANVAAHTTILGKNTPDEFYTSSEPDGASAVNDFSLAHGCDGESVVATVIGFPNGAEVVAEDQDGNEVTAEDVYAALEDNNNLIMGPKPAKDANWKFQEVLTGPVPTYNNHGLKDTDVRAFVYKGGNIPNEFLSLMRWRASFGKIRDNSCVKAIEVRLPIVNYCQRNPSSSARMDAWIGRATAVFADDGTISPGFWPKLTINNTGYTGLDENGGACAAEMTYKVSPSDEDIDNFLPLQSFKP